MTGRIVAAALFVVAPVLAVRIPAGTELNVRLTDKVASEATVQPPAVRAVVIAPVLVNGAVAISAGAQLAGTVKQAKAATDKDPAQLQLVFSTIRDGTQQAGITAIISSLDNARETVDKDGLITGISPGDTFSSRLDQGISKLQNSDKFSGLAGLITQAKQALRINDSDPEIDYDAGVEFTVRVTQPFEWRSGDHGPTANLQAIPNEAGLADLVNRQPFRTMALSSEPAARAGVVSGAGMSPGRPSDITNIMLLATEDELRAAFAKAGWSEAARLNTKSKLETARALIESRGYKEGPMSVLYLDGRPPDMQFEKGNNTFAARHHLRVFRRPDTFDGKPVWVCSSTHDIAIDFSERDRTFIHKIDSDIDRERAKVVNDLLFTGAIRSLALVERPEIPQNATNATGDTLRTDGSMAVLLFQ